jgi:hypothetical protein
MSTISTSGISVSQVIRAEHLLRIIGALNGTTNNTIIISGSLSVTGSATFNSGITGSLQGTSSYAITSSITEAVSGSTNYIPVFSGNRTLISSNIYQDGGGRIGIGLVPQTCASLEITSNGGKSGLLLPLSKTGSVDTPVKGLMIFDDDEDKVAIYTGASWKYLLYES